MIRIESQNNPTIKEIKSLKEQKFRELNKLFFVEGIKLVEESLLNISMVKYIVISDSFLNSSHYYSMVFFKTHFQSNMVLQVPDNVFKNLTDTATPQGILAVLHQIPTSMPDLTKDSSFYILLDCIQDPGNMGTIIRTADAANVDAIFVSKGCVDLYNPKVIRSTMGSIFHVPIIRCDNFIETINTLKQSGIQIISAHLNGEQTIYKMDFNKKIGIVIGNEGNGISDEIVNLSDTLVKIPIPGKAESLNASVAASIFIYEVLRQKSN